MTRTLLIAVAASAFLLVAGPERQQTAQAPAPVFQSKVTLIEVPVVVRDKNGKTVGTLRQEDFQLFDKGKPQVISKFSVEKSGGGKAITQVPTPEAERAPGDNGVTPPVIAPDHFVALLFDDVHMDINHLVYARKAAQQLVGSGLKPADRVAIFTTSGETFLDFTNDRDLLNKTLSKLALHWLRHATEENCPILTVYQADRMVNYSDRIEIAKATGEVKGCYGPISDGDAQAIAMRRGREVVEQGRIETNANMVNLKSVVRKLADMPGQRTLLLASPGFMFMGDQLQDEQPAIDLAIKSGVVINALDVKGVRTSGLFDVGGAGFKEKKASLPEDMETSGILDDLASGTGGRALHQNDLTRGLQELVTAPEVFYLLGFSPQNLKLDGSFHSLKVEVKMKGGLSVEARRGYYAPDHLATAEEEAKAEVDEAVFSLDERNDIPVVISTRFVKASETETKLTVTSQLDVRKLHFRKADGGNVDSVRMVCALFDHDGNFVQAVAKAIDLNLPDASLESAKLNNGIPVLSDFTVPPGTYVIRLVLRDAEGETMTAQNSAVKVP